MRLLVAQCILHFKDVLDCDQPVASRSALPCILSLAPVASATLAAGVPSKLTLDPVSSRARNVVCPIRTSRRGSLCRPRPLPAALSRRCSPE